MYNQFKYRNSLKLTAEQIKKTNKEVMEVAVGEVKVAIKRNFKL